MLKLASSWKSPLKPSLSSGSRRNRAVALSWSKVQAEVEAQDTTTEMETFIAPEAEAEPSTLNRLNLVEAEAPASSETDTNEPPSPVNVLALSTDFPTTRLLGLEKPQARLTPTSTPSVPPC
ncbi:hypothetical protein PM082_023912 [Marasmius tenuissimus]|nr:hypothetical protein PM082_023912 [Marasmius tenuissimus]